MARSKTDPNLQAFIQELEDDPVLAAKEILGADLAPHQRIALKGMWSHSWSMAVWGRGTGKTYMDAVFSSLYAVLNPGSNIVLIGPGFRQAQFIFKEIERLADENPIFMDCIKGGTRGIKHNASEHSIEFKNGSNIYAVPLGNDGSKIRGYRAHVLIIDELVQVPSEIINTVLLPFMSTSRNPMSVYLGYTEEAESNVLIMSTSAYFTFNHAYDRYCTFLKKIRGNEDDKYFLTQFNYKHTPKGFINMEVVEMARAQSTEAEFRTEWEGEWVSDTQGFYPASLIETVGDLGAHPEVNGDPSSSYILGVDPASSYNTCGFCVIKLGEPLKIVRVESISNINNPEICSRILEYMSNYNIVRIGLDAGAGIPIIDLFREGRPVVSRTGNSINMAKMLRLDEDQGVEGRRIIQVIPATSQSVTEINFNMKAAMEGGLVKWPKIAGEADGDLLLEKERLIDEIKGMAAEFRLVEATVTKAGWYSYSVPEHKNKDRYSATLFAHAAAKGYMGSDRPQVLLPGGFWGR
jgi:hypothetical protein